MFDRFKRFVADTTAQMGGRDLPSVAVVLVIAGVVGFIGIQVMSTVVETMDLGENDTFYGATQSLTDAVDQAWGLFGVAFIVVILSVIIVYLYALRGGNGRR